MRNIVITGGSRGIGAAICEEFIKLGDRVFVIYEKNDQSARMLAEKTGAILIKADISSSGDVARARDEIYSVCDSIDVLVNNAGIAEIKLFSDISEADWDRMFDVNVKGAFLMTKAFLPEMINKKSGKIINISSMWGKSGASCEVHYSASKAALIGFTKALAKELAPSGICVNCVAPGIINTDMNASLDKEALGAFCEDIPLMRMGDAKEVAAAVVFLASCGADYITGQILSVDGGMVI